MDQLAPINAAKPKAPEVQLPPSEVAGLSMPTSIFDMQIPQVPQAPQIGGLA